MPGTDEQILFSLPPPHMAVMGYFSPPYICISLKCHHFNARLLEHLLTDIQLCEHSKHIIVLFQNVPSRTHIFLSKKKKSKEDTVHTEAHSLHSGSLLSETFTEWDDGGNFRISQQVAL